MVRTKSYESQMPTKPWAGETHGHNLMLLRQMGGWVGGQEA
jgi:hypothetical protein